MKRMAECFVKGKRYPWQPQVGVFFRLDLPNFSFSVMGKQTAQAKEVYCHHQSNMPVNSSDDKLTDECFSLFARYKNSY